MSFNVSWDIDKYREDHESDEHWQLRRNFIERWKESYPEERLICLARVFANIEFMGCRYPQEVMQEVARMSKEVNSNVTNNNFANTSFDGHSIAQNEPATSYAIEQRLYSTNTDTTNYSDEIQDSRQNQNAWSPYSKVMHSSVSVSKLRTEQPQNFIRENTSNSGIGMASISPGMDLASQSSLTLTTSSLDTHKQYQEPRNVSINQNDNNPGLYTRREGDTINNYNKDDAIVQQESTIDTNWQSSEKPTQTDNILNTHPESNAGICNYVDMSSERNEPSYQEQSNYNMNDNSKQDQAPTHYDGSNTHYSSQNDWRQPETSSGSRNPFNHFDRSNIRSVDKQSKRNDNNPTYAVNVGNTATIGNTPISKPVTTSNIPTGVSNINASTCNISGISNIGNSNINYATADNDAYSEDAGAGVSNIMCNTVPEEHIVSDLESVEMDPPYKRKRLLGKRKLKYKYWLSAGKSKKEAFALSNIRLSRIPEYKVIKQTLGTVNSFHKSKSIPHPQSKTVYNNGYFGHIKLNNMNKQTAKNNDNDPIHMAVNDNTVTVTNTPIIGKPVTTSNIPTGVSNALGGSNCNLAGGSNAMVRHNTASASNNVKEPSNTGYSLSENSQNVKNLHNLDTTSTMKADSQRDLGTEQNRSNSESITQLPFLDNTIIKELKAKTKATMIKLAQKDKFKQQITNIKDANPQSSKIILNSSVIEIPDDKYSCNKANESFEKEMTEKRRIWWLQQGKTEENANILSQKNMTIEDALQIMPNHEVLNKYLQDNVPTVEQETQNVIKHELLNTSGSVSDSMTRGNIGNNEHLNNALNNTNEHNSENMETNKCVTGIQNQTKTTVTYKIPKLKNTRNAQIIEPLTTNPDFTEILPKGVVNPPTTYYKIYVKDAKKEIFPEELLQLQNVIAQCISDHEVKFLRVNRLNGCAVVTCTDEYSRDWLDKEIPSLVPWEGAELKVLKETDILVFIYAWIYVPVVPEVTSVLNPEELLNKLHEKNDNVGCDEWQVLSTQFMGDGQLCFVRFESKSAIVLHSMGYKLNWFGELPIKVKIKQKSQDTLKKLINETVKTGFGKKNVKEFSQNQTKLSRRNRKKANMELNMKTEEDNAVGMSSDNLMIGQSSKCCKVKATANVPDLVHARIYVPVVPEVTSLSKPKYLLRKLHEQNKNIGCLKWTVLKSQFMGEGQVCFLRFESKSAKELLKVGNKLVWFNEKPIKVKINTKIKVKTPVTNPLNQNEFTKLTKRERRRIRRARSCHTNTENILSNQKVDNVNPVAIIIDNDKISQEEIKCDDETAEDVPQVSVSGIGNEKNFNDIGMTCDKSMGYYNLETSTSTFANQDFPTDQAKLVPLDSLPLAENRSAYESQTEQTNRGEMGRSNIIEDHTSYPVDHSNSERSKVKAKTNYWGIDTPRLLPGHRQGIKLKTDLWDEDDHRGRINHVKRVNFARQNYNNAEDFDYQDIFRGDEEYSIEERFFAVRKTGKTQGEGILQESRMLRRDGDNSLSNRNCDESGRVFYRDEDVNEQSRRYNEDTSSQRYSQENVIGKAQPYSNNEMTTNQDEEYCNKDITYARANSQQDYDERVDQMRSMGNTGMNEENRPGKDWDEDNQGYCYDEEELEDWGPGYQQDTQSESYGTYSGHESRQPKPHSAEGYNRERFKGKGNNKVHEYHKRPHEREMKERSRSGNSREFRLEDRVGARQRDSRMDLGHYRDFRNDAPKKISIRGYRRFMKKRNNN